MTRQAKIIITIALMLGMALAALDTSRATLYIPSKVLRVSNMLPFPFALPLQVGWMS